MASPFCKDQILLNILTRNKDTELGQLWNLKEISSVDEFRTKVPLTTYDDYRPYIDRLVNDGDGNLMNNSKTVQFAPSSGTTGPMKLIPIPESVLDTEIPYPNQGERVLLFYGAFPDLSKQPTTPTGLLIAPISYLYCQLLLSLHPDNHPIPEEAYLLPFDIAVYVQLVLGIKDATINIVHTMFIKENLLMISLLKTKYVQMIDDIRSGTLDPSLSIPSDQRRTLEASMGGPDPARAHQLQQIFELAKKNKYKDILSAIWPELEDVRSGFDGNLSSYLFTLRHYISPEVNVISKIYGCSEAGPLGILVKSGFRLDSQNFYEFIRQSDSHQSNPPTLLGSEVTEGQVYEVVITLSNGFYRYRIGDFVKIIKQTETGPLIDLYGRTKMVLHLQDHTLYEMSMELVIATLTSKTPSRIDYTLSIDKTPSHNRYKVWMETDDADINQQTDLDKYIDEELQGIDSSYKEAREAGKIEQITVAMVKEGTFDKIMSFMMSKTFSTQAQLKLPRVVLHENIAQILNENV